MGFFPQTDVHFVLVVAWSGTSNSPVRLLDVGIATCYRLDSLDLIPGVGTRFSLPVETGPGAHLTSCVVGTGFLSRGVNQPGLGHHGLFPVAIL